MVGQPASDPHSAATGHLQPVLLPPSPSDFFSVQIPSLTSTAIKPSRTCDPQSTSADTSDPTPTRIVETIGNWFGEGSSCSGDPLVRCRLRPADLLTFQDLIREHPRWSDKIRYDYFPETETFILRMPPSITHETAASGFYELVKEKLAQLCSEDPASKDWDRELRSDRQTSIDKQLSTTTQETHSPDDQIRHSRAKFPAIILEVANAQRAEDLPELAKYYIEAGEGNTKLVVGVDFDYTTRGSKAIRMITWRLNVEYNSDRTAIGWSIKRQTQAFRTSNGEAVPHAKLRISIKDFAPESLIPKCLVEKFIEISAEEYCQYLDGANARGDEEGISELNLDLNLRRLSSSSSTLDSSGESSGDGGSEPNNKHDGD